MPTKRNDTAQKYLIQQVAACCALHNICEEHMDGFDESWQIDASATSSVLMVWLLEMH